MDLDEESERERRAAVFAKKDQDLADLAAERMGWDTGKIKRFFAESANPDHDPKKQRERDAIDIQLTALEIMRQNARYQAVYQETMQFLSDLALEAEETINSLSQQNDALEVVRRAMLEAAPQLPDGRRIFRDDEGHVRDENGQILAELAAQDVSWPDGAPSHADWQDLSERHEGVGARLEGWQDLRDNHIAPAQEELLNEDDPPSIEDMEGMQTSLQGKANALRRMDDNALEVENASPQISKLALEAPVP